MLRTLLSVCVKEPCCYVLSNKTSSSNEHSVPSTGQSALSGIALIISVNECANYMINNPKDVNIP